MLLTPSLTSELGISHLADPDTTFSPLSLTCALNFTCDNSIPKYAGVVASISNLSKFNCPLLIVTLCVVVNFSLCLHKGSSVSCNIYSSEYIPLCLTSVKVQVSPLSTAVLSLSLYHLNVFAGLVIPGPLEVAVSFILPVPYSKVSVLFSVLLLYSDIDAVVLGLSHTAYNLRFP